MEVNEVLIPLQALQLGGTGVFFPLCFGAGNHLCSGTRGLSGLVVSALSSPKEIRKLP